MGRQPKQSLGEVRNGLVQYVENGTWHYMVKWRGHVLRGDTKCRSQANAKEWLSKERERWANEEHEQPEKPIPTLRETWEAWEKVKTPVVSSTHVRYMKGVVFTHAEKYLDRPLTELTTEAIEMLRAEYLTSEGRGFKKYPKDGLKEGEKAHAVRKHSEGGANKMVGQLRAITGWAVETGRISACPFKLRKLKVSLEASPVLWPEQVPTFLAEVDTIRKERKGDLFPHAGIAARLMIGLGIRENEALHAEWDRIDWRRGIFTVAMARSTHKKVKDRAIREIPIPSWLMAYLKQWWGFQGHPSRGLLLVSRKGKPHGEGATGKATALGGAKLEIIGLTPHCLRKTFATGHWEIGTPLSQIAQMMGHEDPQITFKHYIVERKKDQAEAQERLAQAMGFPITGTDRVQIKTDE
jgi:integrase